MGVRGKNSPSYSYPTTAGTRLPRDSVNAPTTDGQSRRFGCGRRHTTPFQPATDCRPAEPSSRRKTPAGPFEPDGSQTGGAKVRGLGIPTLTRRGRRRALPPMFASSGGAMFTPRTGGRFIQAPGYEKIRGCADSSLPIASRACELVAFAVLIAEAAAFIASTSRNLS